MNMVSKGARELGFQPDLVVTSRLRRRLQLPFPTWATRVVSVITNLWAYYVPILRSTRCWIYRRLFGTSTSQNEKMNMHSSLTRQIICV